MLRLSAWNNDDGTANSIMSYTEFSNNPEIISSEIRQKRNRIVNIGVLSLLLSMKNPIVVKTQQ